MKFYIEAGANDGIFQSRSLHLMNNPEYFGILIEPVPEVYNRCCINRAYNTKTYNCALVDFAYPKPTVGLNLHSQFFAMATISKAVNQTYNGMIQVTARTLDSILEENNISTIDYFYLDVEGYEYNVLNGINFDKRRFNNIEIECHYNLLGISKDEEFNQHINLLNPLGYKLNTINTTEGNPKLIFTYE